MTQVAMTEVIFNAPHWAILFAGSILFFGLYFYLASYKKEMQHMQQLEKNLPKSFYSMNWLAYWARTICLAVSWALLTISIMQPVFKTFIERDQEALPIQYGVNNVDEVVFCVDISQSMQNYLPRAQEVISEVVSNLGGVNISLISFDRDSEMLVPATEDYLYFQIMLNSLGDFKNRSATSSILGLAEYIQGYLEKSKFEKSTLVIMCTNGNDPAVLTNAGPLILTKVEKTHTAFCRWDVIAFGDPEAQKVSFLKELTKSGQGRLYLEQKTPLLSLADSIVADMVVERADKKIELETTLYEEKLAKLPLIAALIFILCALFLPLVQKRKAKMFLCLLLLFPEGRLFCESTVEVGQTIDQALVFAQSLRQDIAEDLLRKLLAKKLTVDERVAVLYDLATLYAKDGNCMRALEFFDQILAQDLQRTKKISATLYASILYNRSVCYVKLSQASINENQTTDVAHFLDKAEKGANKIQDALLKALDTEISYSRLAYLYEAIFVTKQANKRLEFLHEMQKEGKQELLQVGIVELEDLMQKLFMLQDVEDPSATYPYIANFSMAHGYKIRLFVDQIVLFLQAPSSTVSAKMRSFLVDAVLSTKEAIFVAIAKNDLEKLLESIFLLIEQVKLIRFEGTQKDIEGILLLRKETCELRKNAKESFWKNALSVQDAFIRAYIELKIAHTNVQESVYLTQLVERLAKERAPCTNYEADILFWKYIQMPFSRLYPMLFHKEADFSYVLDKLSAAIQIAKLQDAPYEKFEEAKNTVEKGMHGEDRRFYIIASWYAIDPKNALLFLSYYIRQEIKGRLSEEDVSFLVKLLDEFSQDAFASVQKHLREKKAFVTESDRFDLYVTLVWLTGMLQDDDASVQAIAQRVDAAIVLQQDATVAFTKAPDVVTWVWYLQHSLVEKIADVVKKSTLDKVLAKKIATLLEEAMEYLELAPNRSSSKNVQKILLDIKKLLESEAQSQAKEEQKEPPKKARELELEMKKRTLNVSKESSVRLLQELELDDRKLFSS